MSKLPKLLTVNEVAELICTTRQAVYNMAARHQLPGITRIGRRVLFRQSEVLRWLDEKRVTSPGK